MHTPFMHFLRTSWLNMLQSRSLPFLFKFMTLPWNQRALVIRGIRTTLTLVHPSSVTKIVVAGLRASCIHYLEQVTHSAPQISTNAQRLATPYIARDELKVFTDSFIPWRSATVLILQALFYQDTSLISSGAPVSSLLYIQCLIRTSTNPLSPSIRFYCSLVIFAKQCQRSFQMCLQEYIYLLRDTSIISHSSSSIYEVRITFVLYQQFLIVLICFFWHPSSILTRILDDIFNSAVL